VTAFSFASAFFSSFFSAVAAALSSFCCCNSASLRVGCDRGDNRLLPLMKVFSRDTLRLTLRLASRVSPLSLGNILVLLTLPCLVGDNCEAFVFILLTLPFLDGDNCAALKLFCRLKLFCLLKLFCFLKLVCFDIDMLFGDVSGLPRPASTSLVC
jgi:hypothetical protein